MIKTFVSNNEFELEQQLISKCIELGYEYAKFKNHDELEANAREKIEKLNEFKFSDDEWARFVDEFLLARTKSDVLEQRSKMILTNEMIEFVDEFGEIRNIKLIERNEIHKNSFEIINQFSLNERRFDVTLLINGIPLTAIELKRPSVSVKDAFFQFHKYQKECFNDYRTLFSYVQMCVISNGGSTRYFANRIGLSYDFTIKLSDANNHHIDDLANFTQEFLNPKSLFEAIFKYSVLNADNNLMLLRPYQITACKKILQKVRDTDGGDINSGGYIWHTTGSGKTLTSFKASKLCFELSDVFKVLFVVDRKDLDAQTIREYESFEAGSVDQSPNSNRLEKNLKSDSKKIIVTTIQKLNNVLKKYENLGKRLRAFDEKVVIIFDECHRSQFGKTHQNIVKTFTKYHIFGFTGTPIFEKNSNCGQITAQIFGERLHSYLITDALNDKKVLPFNIEYYGDENESDEWLASDKRKEKIAKKLLELYEQKTQRNQNLSKKFNAIFCTDSKLNAKKYYELLKNSKLKIAVIFSVNANESDEDEIDDGGKVMPSDKEFLQLAANEYNEHFGTNFDIDSGFDEYYKDVAKRTKDCEIDLLIVVGMFLTGFDSKQINTIFVDKNLQYHGLIQAYSRTNRILDNTKIIGNVVCFRNLREKTNEALALFGDEVEDAIKLTKLIKNYDDFLTQYIECKLKAFELFAKLDEFSDDDSVRAFVRIFSQLLRLESALRNFSQWQDEGNKISSETLEKMQAKYLEIKDEFEEKNAKTDEKECENLSFELELFEACTVDARYILQQVAGVEKSLRENKVKELAKTSIHTRKIEDVMTKYVNSLGENELDYDEFLSFAKNEEIAEVGQIVSKLGLKERNSDGQSFFEFYQETSDFLHGDGLAGFLQNAKFFGGDRVQKRKSASEQCEKLKSKYALLH